MLVAKPALYATFFALIYATVKAALLPNVQECDATKV